jgi:NADH:ubiquinone oxidoreductase subunit 4 (subunit M)
VIGAAGIVLAAMYVLRAISGVLHQEPGPAVTDAALDLRLGELAIVAPLVVCLLGLSAWPNLISGHAFGGNQAKATIEQGLGK